MREKTREWHTHIHAFHIDAGTLKTFTSELHSILLKLKIYTLFYAKRSAALATMNLIENMKKESFQQ